MESGQGSRGGGRGRGGGGGGRGGGRGRRGTSAFSSSSSSTRAGGAGAWPGTKPGRGGGRGRGRGGGRGSSATRDANAKPSSTKRSWSSDSAGWEGGGDRRGGAGKGGYSREGIGGGSEWQGSKDANDVLPSNKKRRLKMERQQYRPEFDTVLRSKEIWNKLRERKVPSKERAKLVQELLRLIKGKVLAISMKHDASRVVQTAIQFGSQEERLSILSELENHLVELSQVLYAHFIVMRLFKESKGAEERNRVVKAFRGQVVKLATHSIGARVVQTALESLPVAAAVLIKAEFYGKEFALFLDGEQPRSLAGVLEARPDRRDVVMGHVSAVIGRILAKGLMQFGYAHELLWEYMQQATPVQMQELVPQLVESFVVLLSTRAGSMAAAMCAAHGGAKERKRMLRALKGLVATSLLHRDAYVAVIRLVESVDDTITCQKMLLAELLQPLEVTPAKTAEDVCTPAKGTSAEEWVPRGQTAPKVVAVAGQNGEEGVVAGDMDIDSEEGGAVETEGRVEGSTGDVDAMDEEGVKEDAPMALVAVMTNRNGCKLLLRLLAPDHTGYLHPEELDLLKPTMVPAKGASSADTSSGEKKIKQEPGTVSLVPSSKKEASVRRRELLAYLREPLRESCAAHANELMRSKFAGALVLVETVRTIGTPQLVQALVEAACAKPQEMQLPMHEDAVGHLFMKQVLKHEAEAQQKLENGDSTAGTPSSEPESSPTGGCFADALVAHLGDGLAKWAMSSNRGAFVVTALEMVPSAKAAVRKIMEESSVKADLVKAARDGKMMGPKVLAEQLGFGEFGAKASAAEQLAKKKPSQIKQEV